MADNEKGTIPLPDLDANAGAAGQDDVPIATEPSTQ